MFRHVSIITICALCFTHVSFLVLDHTTAQVMQGSLYQIESDSINVGGTLSDSESYTLEDTTGEQATGLSESDNFRLRAGYQQMQAAQLSMSPIPSVVLEPSIPGVSGGVANGSTTVTVSTDSAGGYQVSIASLTNPALQTSGGTSTIDNYVPSGDADFTFATGTTLAQFGYSVESVDAAVRFRHSGGSCGDAGGANTPLTCWDGLTTTPKETIRRGNSNHPNGTESKFHFRVDVGESVLLPPGEYLATTTVTAIAL